MTVDSDTAVGNPSLEGRLRHPPRGSNAPHPHFYRFRNADDRQTWLMENLKVPVYLEPPSTKAICGMAWENTPSLVQHHRERMESACGFRYVETRIREPGMLASKPTAWARILKGVV